MARLNILDTGFLRAPDPNQHASMAMGAAAVVNGSAPDHKLIKHLLAERIQPSFGLPSDLARHMHRVGVPSPGDETELHRAIASALERPIELDPPLWECWIIEGLQDDQWAILLKTHCSVANDLSATRLLARLSDDADNDSFANAPAAQQLSPVPADPANWAENLWQMQVSVAKAATAIFWPAARPHHTRRRYHTVRVPRAAADRVASKFGVTANHVALAAITEGFRTVLVSRGEQPRADSLRTLAPALPYLPVDHEDPIQQLRAVQSTLSRIASTSPGNSPLALCTKAFHALTRRQDTVTLATTAPGPRHRLRLVGQRIERLLPIPPTGIEQSTGVGVLSYGNDLIFGISADYDAAPDMEQLAAGIELGMTRLLALSQGSVLLFERRRTRPARALSKTAIHRRPPAPHARARR